MGMWSRKPIAEIAAEASAEEKGLKRVLSAPALTLLGIGAVVGAGLFSLTGIAAAENAGPAITIAFLIAATGCLFSGLCYCELASMIPVAGSAYTYTFATMGEFAAWMMGWNLILEYALGSAAVSVSWSAYVVSLLHSLGVTLPPQLIASPWQSVALSDGTRVFGWINLPAFLIVTLISGLLIRGIQVSTFFNSLIVLIKIGAVLAFISIGFFYIHPENYTPFIPPNTGEVGSFGWSGILRASGVLFFSYIGFDAITTAAQETKNPQRNIPIGILASLAVCTLLYVLFGFVLTGLVNYKELAVAAPAALAAAKIPLWGVSHLIDLAILCGLTSVILVMLLGQSRIFYAMSRDKLLPHWFSAIHPKFQTPWHSNLVLIFFVGTIGAFAPLSAIGHMTSIGTLFAFVFVSIGVLVLRYKDPSRERPFRAPFSPVVPLLGVAICLLMMGFLDRDAWERLLYWQFFGLLIYFFSRSQSRV